MNFKKVLKSAITVLLAVIMLSTTVFAGDFMETAQNEQLKMLKEKWVNGNFSQGFLSYKLTLRGTNEEINFLNNEYYNIFADYYVEKVFGAYKKIYPEKPEHKIEEYLANGINNCFDNCIYFDLGERCCNKHTEYLYVVVIARAEKIPDGNDKTGFCVFDGGYYAYKELITSKIVLEALLGDENVEFVARFDPDIGGLLINEAIFEQEFTPNSADARKILRYAAFLDKAPENRADAKEFFFMSDTNLDGKITAQDARMALRIASKLEKGRAYCTSGAGLGEFWLY